MDHAELIRAARRVAAEDVDPHAEGLDRLTGGMSQDVFSPIDDPSVVAKVFDAAGVEAAEREWAALVAIADAGGGLAPTPLRLAREGGNPVVVMTRVAGAPLPGHALHVGHAEAIGAAHRRVHGVVVGAPPRDVPHAGLLLARTALLHGASPSTAQRAWTEARAWMATSELDRLLTSDAPLRFSRGDPNLRNYLWHEGRVVLVDWEDSGYNDVAVELADMVEHASTRDVGEDLWVALAHAVGLHDADRLRIAVARRAMACFWLVLIEDRHRRGLPTTVTLEEQAIRTLAVLGG